MILHCIYFLSSIKHTISLSLRGLNSREILFGEAAQLPLECHGFNSHPPHIWYPLRLHFESPKWFTAVAAPLQELLYNWRFIDLCRNTWFISVAPSSLAERLNLQYGAYSCVHFGSSINISLPKFRICLIFDKNSQIVGLKFVFKLLSMARSYGSLIGNLVIRLCVLKP